ncbi:MAG: DUF1593 domain-containing protein [Prolixibacteraceae bacterium]|jgi:hypothetical protein|nr:DUF1593 domain-containing protein [Prolixibacteraceae bacterium]
MKTIKILLMLLVVNTTLVVGANSANLPEKQRIFILTDIENEPDDAMSLVRFLLYSNQFDIEGIAATTSIHQRDQIATWRIKEIVEAYAKVRDNLILHEPGFPTYDQLQACITEGLPEFGMSAVGEGKDSPASEKLIAAVDKNDDRPLWVTVWGGPNVLAQALWKVKQTRTEEELDEFVSKIRVYTISDQDNSGPWIRKTFKDLFYVASPGYHRYGGYHHATWSGISGDYFHARCDGGNFEIVDNPWLDMHIRSKGPLGAEYPQVEYLMEGDSPSFMFLINNGLNNPDRPDWGGWGGRYELYQPRFEKWFLEPETRPLYTNVADEVMGHDGRWHDTNHATIWRWREHFQNDFAARMDWTIKPYEEANHPPIAKVATEKYITVKSNERVSLSAEGSEDSDGDNLTYKWIHYGEPGTFALGTARTAHAVKINDDDKKNAWFTAPRMGNMGTMHIILMVTDDGTPSLTRYQRVIVEVEK